MAYPSEDRFWQLLEAKVGEPIPAQVRDAMREQRDVRTWQEAVHRGGPDDADIDLYARIARVGLSATSPARRVTWKAADADDPPWWPAKVQEMFAGLETLEAEARTILDLPDLVPVQDVRGLLEARADLERREGDRLRLYYPTGFPELPFGFMTVRRGYSRDEYIDTWNGENPAAEAVGAFVKGEVAAAGTLLRQVKPWNPPEQPLARIVGLQDRVPRLTGCDPWQAVAFLLCGEVPSLPAVRIEASGLGSARWVRVMVGDVRIGGEKVAAVYATHRSRVLKAGEAAARGRQPSEWPHRVRVFVDECVRAGRYVRPGGRPDWTAMYAAFQKEWADKGSPFTNRRSFSERYNAQLRAERAKAKEGDR